MTRRVRWSRTALDEIKVQVGYIALDAPLYEALLKRFQAGTIGTLFPKGAEVGSTLDRYRNP